jgi:putative heme-binding domain-containing protein
MWRRLCQSLSLSASVAVRRGSYLQFCIPTLAGFSNKCRMFSVIRGTMAWLTAALIASAAQTNDPFAEYVRSTEPLAPQAEAKSFRLPDGFEIQLFAAEPDIAKPMNMAFDERGRLWITESREYPFPAPLDKKGRDAIKILEDTDADGRADKITTFADGLNIPIGIYPYKGGAIAWSIPNIWHFQDTDGDGKADQRDVLFGPLGWEKDTHGMNASFRRGFDGWIYITHGFNNTSVIKGRDGSELKINSGNTYRVRPDGSRVEIHAWGQVNPFGLTFDPLGYLYSADCHSSPIYQLIHGAYYPSFGKPDDGLGVAPVLMQHSHNSTAIGGIAYYADDRWPPDFRDNIFVGNVMTSRVNRDQLRFSGSSPSAKELPDFLTSTDPWFRPVDLQFGPDGALYVADFYNRIIGHYEVPLTHPGRDRERGRIWRITYKTSKPSPPRFNLVGLAPDQVVAEFASPNLTRRLLALNHLVDSVGRAGLEAARRALATSANSDARVASLWALHRLGALPSRDLSPSFSHDDPKVRVHAARVLAEIPAWDYDAGLSAVQASNDIHPHVQRAGAEALGQHPSLKTLERMIVALQFVPPADNHLLHTLRIALRNHLQLKGAFAALDEVPGGLTERSARAVADVCVAVPNQEAAAFLLRHVEKYADPTATAAKYLRHVAKYLPPHEVDRLVQLARGKFASDADGQFAMFKSVQDGLAQRGQNLTGAAKSWGEELAVAFLKSPAENEIDWSNKPIEGARDTQNPWFVQRRKCADDANARFLCSLPPGGEHLTGVLRSPSFTIPQRLTFYLAGHDGPPDKPPHGKNRVRLRGPQDEVLIQAAPPRNDTAQKITWDLAAHAGKTGFIEVVDADTGGAYAWLAIGRFEPAVVAIPKLDPSEISKRQLAAAELARTLRLKHLQPQLSTLLGKGNDVAVAAARALAALADNAELEALAFLYADRSAPALLQPRLAGAFAKPADAAQTREVAQEAMRISPSRLQLKLAQGLAASAKGSETLIALAEQRLAPPALLQDRSVREKLLASNPALARRIDDLTKGLTPPNEAIEKLIDRRRKGFEGSNGRVAEGGQLFTKHCAACHQINKQGGLVGPQLDGIRNRGVERLLEDILDPNRSVDAAFRTTLLVLKDGDVTSGLLRREEGETVVLADSTGKEITIPKKQVAERRQSDTSLMPENFGELLSPEEFNHLLAYLLSH